MDETIRRLVEERMMPLRGLMPLQEVSALYEIMLQIVRRLDKMSRDLEEVKEQLKEIRRILGERTE
ncbi:MAG: hypothetical protein DRN15_00285 [Thermoprotei archaeon]|nr:MAG: hypothetical protein DRM97_02400 [Thermoprotei archaeon]RLF25132.1 MAG: hypothetical protein DRN15_00285 [Thermoprotei archaeon]